MEDKLHTFFSENNFDFKEPHSGHFNRFEQKLNTPKKNKKTSWKWLSIAASVLLLVGFWIGTHYQKKQLDLGDISPKMAEAQTYFESSIYQELKNLEKNRNLDTESIIEHSLNTLEGLEDEYTIFIKDLTKNGPQVKVISAMIKNYQKRLEILENTLQLIEKNKQLKIVNNDIYL